MPCEACLTLLKCYLGDFYKNQPVNSNYVLTDSAAELRAAPPTNKRMGPCARPALLNRAGKRTVHSRSLGLRGLAWDGGVQGPLPLEQGISLFCGTPPNPSGGASPCCPVHMCPTWERVCRACWLAFEQLDARAQHQTDQPASPLPRPMQGEVWAPKPSIGQTGLHCPMLGEVWVRG